MVLELSGSKSDFKKGVGYLKGEGIKVDSASREIKRDEKKCTQCGACTAVCPTQALFIQRPEMSVGFDENKCSVCELCVPACPPRAMIVRPTEKAFT